MAHPYQRVVDGLFRTFGNDGLYRPTPAAEAVAVRVVLATVDELQRATAVAAGRRPGFRADLRATEVPDRPPRGALVQVGETVLRVNTARADLVELVWILDVDEVQVAPWPATPGAYQVPLMTGATWW